MKRISLNITSSEIDQFLELNVPNFFMMMQKIASDDAESFGIGKSETLDKGLTWIISRIEVDFIKTPSYTQDVELETYPGDDMKIIFPRYYTMFDKDNNVIIRASSIWAVLDQKTRMPVANPFDKSFPSEHHENELPLPSKVKIPDELTLVESRKVRYSEIDLNGHLNNTRYMDYMLDVHDSAFYRENHIRHIVINYAHEIRDGQTVDIYSSKTNPEVIVGKVGEQLIFATKVTYEKR